MPVESPRDLMEHARRHRYALGYFESWNLESLQGVIDAAEQTRSPIIIGFSGDFLTRPDRIATERIECYGRLARAAAESAKVPCGVIFNECPIDSCVLAAMECGFNIVSMADPEAMPTDYARRVAAVVSAARAKGIAVEAEVGELPCSASGAEQSGHATTPEQAAQFVRDTGLDMLAVSVGNVHILTKGQQDLDLARLAEIHRLADVPLVLHGGTGISPDSLRAAIDLGVRKVNYGTYLKQRYLQTLRRALECPDENPHRMLGMGGPEDIMVAGRLAVKEAVLERLGHLNCVEKA